MKGSDKLGSMTQTNELQVQWHSLDSHETLVVLESSPATGLSSVEAKSRLQTYGYNQLQEKPRPSFLSRVIGQLNNFVIILLIIAAAISAILGEYIDAGAILTIVLLNTILGVVQEGRAEEALAALKKMASPEAQVLRDGRRLTLPSRELVPGDIVVLEAGNFVPADVRLLEAVNLRVEEAALTGESVAVEKNAALVLQDNIPLGDRKNTAFMGTTVVYGRGRAVVTSTGMHTHLGMIAALLQSVEDEVTPLQRRLDQLGRTLGWACLVICAIVFIAGWVQGGDPLELFMIAVSLAIAAVPEGLPAIVTISLALGMQEMIRRHALIRRLSSVETLGSATVICSDKTGTLTQNEMTVTNCWVDGSSFHFTGNGYSPVGDILLDGKKIDPKKYPALSSALWLGVLNNDATLENQVSDSGEPMVRIIGDPTEGSILVAALKAGIMSQVINLAYPRENEVPFDSTRKRMVTIHAIADPKPEDPSPYNDTTSKGGAVVVVKGAPDVVLGLCTHYQLSDNKSIGELTTDARKRILDANEYMTRDALRVLGVAYRQAGSIPEKPEADSLEKDLIFVGLIGMIDPARPEVRPALLTAVKAGIRTIMITGDFPNTASAIARSIGMLEGNRRVLTGVQLDQMDDIELKKMVLDTDVFARVSPEHKMRIVEALRANGDVVAMTGDGVNDAPAIKRADIGISMGITGTDVAKETADMVLTDDNYASIVSAVEQGRIIYSNIRKFVYFLISCNMAEIMIIFLPTILGKGSPLAPIQLLWLNLLTDGAPALALGTEKGDPDIMQQKPRPPKEPIINRFMVSGVAVQTVAITAATLTAYLIGLSYDPLVAGTLAFITLSVSELFRAYTARSERYPILKIGLFNNKWMNYAVLSSLGMLLMVIYIPFLNPIFKTVPLGLEEWGIILPLVLIPSVVAEVYKTILQWRSK